MDLDQHEKAADTPLLRSDLSPLSADQTTAAPMPEHERVYQDLRARILFGDYAPGQALTLHGLTQDTGAGLTPVREAVRRLIAEGAVKRRGNRRLELPKLTTSDLSELRFLRAQLEPELTRRASTRLSAATLDSLRNCDAALNAAIHRGDIPGYLRLNHRFHHTLYAAADAPILLQTVELLWLRFGPSLRVVCGLFGTMNLPDEHAQILDALAHGDAVRAAQAMSADVCQGLDQIAQSAQMIDLR